MDDDGIQAEIGESRVKDGATIVTIVAVMGSLAILLVVMPELFYFLVPAIGIAALALFVIHKINNRYEIADGSTAEINIARISVGGGVAGAIFTLGSMWIFLAGIPALWYFLALAIATGLGVAAALRFTDPAR